MISCKIRQTLAITFKREFDLKTRYFGYYFKEHNSGKKYFSDVRALLKNFTDFDCSKYNAAHMFFSASMILCVNSMIHVLILIFAFIRIHMRSASY